MRLNKKFLSVILVAGVTLGGVLYTSSEDSAFFEKNTTYNAVRATPQLNITRHVVRSTGSQQSDEGLASAPELGSGSISQDRPASISSGSAFSHTSSGASYASARNRTSSSQQSGGAIFHRASSRTGSSSARYASSSFSSGSLASNSLESDLNATTRASATSATGDGAMDPGGIPTGSAIPIADGTPILLLLAIGYAVWKFRKTSTAS